MVSLKKYAGMFLILEAIVFAHIETKYFGDNWLPSSFAELACDLLSVGTCFIGIHLMASKTLTP